MRGPLFVERLLQGGFAELGCWELNSALDLAHSINLPRQPGVYAFAVDEIVQYVGLASKSVAQRLGFYRRPGASQRTNIRLNEIIRGHLAEGTIVRILVAHPTDFGWNGFKISGAEGLEAGLIAEFDLPWNVRGGSAAMPSTPTARQQRTKGAANRVMEVIRKRPGMTELEIAKAIYGPGAVQQQVNQHCRSLLKQGRVERSGTGGQADPFTYRARG